MTSQRNRSRGARRGRPDSGDSHEGQAGQHVQQAAGNPGAERGQEPAGGELFPEQPEGGSEHQHDVLGLDDSGQRQPRQEAQHGPVQPAAPVSVAKRKRFIINGRTHMCTQREADELMMRQAMGWPV